MTDRRSDVAVIVPCRNYGRFLGDALSSIAAQTTRPSEVVVIDDGSTDGTTVFMADILAELGEELPNLRSIRTEPRGLANAVRVGVAATGSPLIARLDADDMLAPTYIEKLVSMLRHCPRAAYTYSATRLFGSAVGVYPTHSFDAARLVIGGNFVNAGAMVRRSAYMASGGIADLPAWEDWDLWLRFLELGLTGVLVDEPLYLWRRHAQSRNRLNLARRRLLRLRIWSRHPRLVARYALPGARYFIDRLLHPVGLR
jgi:glycosyltransferase involved in cell wall biosynthesis